jgi:hypothetical protein
MMRPIAAPPQPTALPLRTAQELLLSTEPSIDGVLPIFAAKPGFSLGQTYLNIEVKVFKQLNNRARNVLFLINLSASEHVKNKQTQHWADKPGVSLS